MAKVKRTNNDLQNTKLKTKYSPTEIPQKCKKSLKIPKG